MLDDMIKWNDPLTKIFLNHLKNWTLHILNKIECYNIL